MPTTTEILRYARISEYLASNEVAEGVLFGEPVNHLIPVQIYVEYEAVKYRYDYEGILGGAEPSTELISAANYLYSLLGRYAFVITGGGAGYIPNTGGNSGLYSYPIQGSYTSATEGETVIPITLPSGSKITWVVKGVSPLAPINYTWVQPNFTLLNGFAMSEFEILSYQYVVPIN